MIKNNELVSVIIPVYKVESYLKRAVDSVIAQTYGNIEIILVDDGSPDNCGKICDEYAEQDARIFVIHKQNGGISNARNAGLGVSHGKYICFVDSDDWLETTYVESMVDAFEKHGVDLVACGVHKTDRPKAKIDDTEEVIIKDKYMSTLQDDNIAGYAWNKLFLLDIIRRNCLQFDENIFIGEDLLFVVSYLEYCVKTLFLQQELYNYFIRPGSATTNITFSDKYATVLRSRECVMQIFEAEKEQACLNIERRSYLMHLIKLYYLAKDTSKSKKEWRSEFKRKMKKHLPAVMRSQYITAKSKVQIVLMWYGRLIIGPLYRKKTSA